MQHHDRPDIIALHTKIDNRIHNASEISEQRHIVDEAERLSSIPGRLQDALREAQKAVDYLDAYYLSEKAREMSVALSVAGLCEVKSGLGHASTVLGELRLAASDRDRAKEALLRGVDLTGSARARANWAAWLSAERDNWSEAYYLLEELMQEEDTNSEDMCRVARGWVALGELEKSEEAISLARQRGCSAGEANYHLGYAYENKYCLSLQKLNLDAGDLEAHSRAIYYYTMAVKRNGKKDARTRYRLALLSEETFFQRLMYRTAPVEDMVAQDGGEDDTSREARLEEERRAEKDIREVLYSHRRTVGAGKDSAAQLEALTLEHNKCVEEEDHGRAEEMQRLYSFKVAQLRARTGGLVRDLDLDVSLQHALLYYQEALQGEHECGAEVYVHMARVQRLLGDMEAALSTVMKCRKSFASDAGSMLYMCICKRPIQDGEECPNLYMELIMPVMDVLSSAVQLGAELPIGPLAETQMWHITNLDLVHTAVHMAQTSVDKKHPERAERLLRGIVQVLPEACRMLQPGSVAHRELVRHLETGRYIYLRALMSRDAHSEAFPVYDTLYEELMDAPPATGQIAELDKLVQVAMIGTKLRPHWSEGFYRLGHVAVMRVDRDLELLRSDKETQRRQLLTEAEGYLRQALVLEGAEDPMISRLVPYYREKASRRQRWQSDDERSETAEEEQQRWRGKAFLNRGTVGGRKAPIPPPRRRLPPRKRLVAGSGGSGMGAARKQLVEIAATPSMEPANNNAENEQVVSEVSSRHKPLEANPRSAETRTLLATVLQEQGLDKGAAEEIRMLYKEAKEIDPRNVEAHTGNGAIMDAGSLLDAALAISHFPDPESKPTFDDSFIHQEIVRLMLKHASTTGAAETFDHPQLAKSLSIVGSVMGLDSISDDLEKLAENGRWTICRQTVQAISAHKADGAALDVDLEIFLRSKGWCDPAEYAT